MLKSSFFGTGSSVPALCRADGSDLLSSSFNSKQNDKILNLTSGCHSEPILNSFAFRSSELKSLLIDLIQSSGVDQNGLFPLVLIMIVDNSAPKLAAVSRILIR